MAKRASEDVTKLPKWAQSRIDVLERSVEHYKEKLREMDAGETDIAIRNYDEGDVHLPSGSTIVFRTPTGVFDVSMRDGCLEVSERDGNGMIIRPQVSNVIRVFGDKEGKFR